MLAGLALTAGPASAAGWSWEWDGARGCWNGAWFDTDGNGVMNVAWGDIDGDCRVDTVVVDADGRDGLLELVWSDSNGDGRWDVVLTDTNQAVGYDYYWVDANGDGVWEQSGWVQYGAPASVTTVVSGGGSPFAAVFALAAHTGCVRW